MSTFKTCVVDVVVVVDDDVVIVDDVIVVDAVDVIVVDDVVGSPPPGVALLSGAEAQTLFTRLGAGGGAGLCLE